MENECEALPDVAYPGVRDNRSTINTKTGYDDDDDDVVKGDLNHALILLGLVLHMLVVFINCLGFCVVTQ